MQAPREISREEAGSTDPVPAGGGNDPAGVDPNADPGSGTPNDGNPPSPKKDDGQPLDPKDFIKKSDYDEAVKQRDRNYARLKKAEAKLKEKGITLEEDEPVPSPRTPDSTADPFSLAKQTRALSDLDDQEIDFAAFVARGKNISPAEAIKTPEFETFLKGKRGADFKSSKVPAPGSGSPRGSQLPDADAIGKMSKDAHEKLDREYQKRQQGGSGF